MNFSKKDIGHQKRTKLDVKLSHGMFGEFRIK